MYFAARKGPNTFIRPRLLILNCVLFSQSIYIKSLICVLGTGSYLYPWRRVDTSAIWIENKVPVACKCTLAGSSVDFIRFISIFTPKSKLFSMV